MRTTFLLLFLVFCMFIGVIYPVHAADRTLRFDWEQDLNLNPVDHWIVYKSDTAGGPYEIFATIQFVAPDEAYSDTQVINVPDGQVSTIYFVIVSFGEDGQFSPNSLEKSIQIDLEAPKAPMVTVEASTNLKFPTWTWATAGGGNGTFRYKLDDNDLTTGAVETTALTFTPTSDLTIGLHTLYVQERDDAGNWSDSGSSLYDVISPPATPFNFTVTIIAQ